MCCCCFFFILNGQLRRFDSILLSEKRQRLARRKNPSEAGRGQQDAVDTLQLAKTTVTAYEDFVLYTMYCCLWDWLDEGKNEIRETD